MKWIFGRTAMWIWATFAVATMAFAATQDVPLPDGDGKKILQTACTACHGLDGVVSLHQDKAAWEGLISSMVSNGAQVDTKDFPVLVDYLVKNFKMDDTRVRTIGLGKSPEVNSDGVEVLVYPAATSEVSAKSNSRQPQPAGK